MLRRSEGAPLSALCKHACLNDNYGAITPVPTARKAPTSPQASPGGRRLQHDAIARMGEPQHLAGNFFDEIRIGEIGAEQSDIALELGAHSLEALDLELQSAFTLRKSISRLEAMPAFYGVIGEISRQS